MKIVFVLIVSLGLVDASCYYNRPTNSSSQPPNPCLACKAIQELQKYIKDGVTSIGSYSYDPFGDNLWIILRQNIDVISQNNWDRFVKWWNGVRVNRNPDLLAREVIDVLSPSVLKCCGMVEINPTTGKGSFITNGGNVGVNASAGNLPSGLTSCQAKRILLDYFKKRADTPQGPKLLKILSQITAQGFLTRKAKAAFTIRLRAKKNPYVIASQLISVLRRPRVNNCCKNKNGGNAGVGVGPSNRDGGVDATDRDDGVDATDSDDGVDATDRNGGANARAGNVAINTTDFSEFYLTASKYEWANRKVKEYVNIINKQGQSYDPSGDKFLALLKTAGGVFTQKKLNVFEELKKGALKGAPLALAQKALQYIKVAKAFVILEGYINEVTEKGQASFDPSGSLLLDILKGFQDEVLIRPDDLKQYGSDWTGKTRTIAIEVSDKIVIYYSGEHNVEIC